MACTERGQNVPVERRIDLRDAGDGGETPIVLGVVAAERADVVQRAPFRVEQIVPRARARGFQLLSSSPVITAS